MQQGHKQRRAAVPLGSEDSVKPRGHTVEVEMPRIKQQHDAHAAGMVRAAGMGLPHDGDPARRSRQHKHATPPVARQADRPDSKQQQAGAKRAAPPPAAQAEQQRAPAAKRHQPAPAKHPAAEGSRWQDALQMLIEKDRLVVKKDNEACEAKEQLAQAQDAHARELCAAQEQAGQQAGVLQREVRGLKQEMLSKDAAMERMVGAHDADLAAAKGEAKGFAARLRAREKELHQALLEKEQVIADRDGHMADYDAAILEQQQQIQELEAQLAGQEVVKSECDAAAEAQAAAAAAAEQRALAHIMPPPSGEHSDALRLCQQELAAEQRAHAHTHAAGAEVAAELARSTAELARKEAQLKACQRKLADNIKDIGRQQLSKNKAVGERHNAQSRATALEAQTFTRAQQHSADMAAMRAAHAASEERTAAHAAEAQRAAAKAAELRSRDALREVAVAGLSRECRQLREEAAALQRSEAELRAGMRALQGANASQAADLARAAADVEAARAELGAKLGEAAAQLDETEELAGREVQRNTALQAQLVHAQGAAEAARQEAHACMRASTAAEQEAERLRGAEAGGAALLANRARLTAELHAAQQQLAAQAAGSGALQAAHARLQDEHEELKQGSHAELQQLLLTVANLEAHVCTGA